MTIIKLLKKIKKTLFWYFVIKYIIKPIYDFVWLNVINIHGRILYFSWFSKNKKSELLKIMIKQYLTNLKMLKKLLLS